MNDEFQMKQFFKSNYDMMEESGYIDEKLIKEILKERKTFAERLMEVQAERLKKEQNK